MSILILFDLILISCGLSTAAGNTNVLFVVDGSGSMRGKMEGQKKIAIAEEQMTSLVEKLDNVNMGRIAHAHRHKADCNDIQLIENFRRKIQGSRSSMRACGYRGTDDKSPV